MITNQELLGRAIHATATTTIVNEQGKRVEVLRGQNFVLTEKLIKNNSDMFGVTIFDCLFDNRPKQNIKVGARGFAAGTWEQNNQTENPYASRLKAEAEAEAAFDEREAMRERMDAYANEVRDSGYRASQQATNGQ